MSSATEAVWTCSTATSSTEVSSVARRAGEGRAAALAGRGFMRDVQTTPDFTAQVIKDTFCACRRLSNDAHVSMRYIAAVASDAFGRAPPQRCNAASLVVSHG